MEKFCNIKFLGFNLEALPGAEEADINCRQDERDCCVNPILCFPAVYQDEPFLPKGPPQQSRGHEGSDEAILPRLTRLAMSNDPPHTTPQPLS
ncbi:hypothetical protein E2C01_099913 [Portunus trituberculatus]|uniref:Uncharacterized protein n=1 Tax=Portunus trituberculatus TaxID=210409 RepID=A0A5B7KC56_PORTR|nr:hypothetical protein [Portunus trituberculatus]